MRWGFSYDGEESTYAIGSDSASVLSLAFLTWLDGRDVNKIDDPSGLAGFLACHSDLSRRELAGLLGTFSFPTPSSETQFEFEYAGASVCLKHDVADTPPSETERV
jgi:hypothetical protein